MDYPPTRLNFSFLSLIHFAHTPSIQVCSWEGKKHTQDWVFSIANWIIIEYIFMFAGVCNSSGFFFDIALFICVLSLCFVIVYKIWSSPFKCSCGCRSYTSWAVQRAGPSFIDHSFLVLEYSFWYLFFRHVIVVFTMSLYRITQFFITFAFTEVHKASWKRESKILKKCLCKKRSQTSSDFLKWIACLSFLLFFACSSIQLTGRHRHRNNQQTSSPKNFPRCGFYQYIWKSKSSKCTWD